MKIKGFNLTPWNLNSIYFFNPTKIGWVHFFYFLFFNFLVSYGPLNFQEKSWIALAGIIVPIILLITIFSLSGPSSSARKSDWEIKVFSLSPWLICLLLFFASFLRFYKLTSFIQWPSFDESMFGFFSTELLKNWQFHLFYGISQTPPLFFWALAFTFKIFGVSLFSLWLLPALVSTLTIPLVWLTVRNFFSLSAAWLFVGLWSFSFWPMYEGRYCVQYALYMFWIWLTLYLFSLFVRSNSNPARYINLFLTAVAMGLGFYVSTGWPLVAVAITGLVFYFSKQNFKYFLIYFLVLSVFLSPLITSLIRHEYGLYIQNLWAFKNSFSIKDHLFNVWLYIAGLFWGIPNSYKISSYGPTWGGMLNPILDSFFLIGFIEFIKLRFNWLSKLLWGSLLFFFIPALLTKDLEFFRIFQILPLLFIFIIFGIQHLMKKILLPKRSLTLMGILIVSLGLDAYQLFGPCVNEAVSSDAWPYKSFARYNAYKILDAVQKQRGPGIIFDNFQNYVDLEDMEKYGDVTQKYTDRSLTVASYTFNVLVNSQFTTKEAQWAAVLVDLPFKQYLACLFPAANWYPLNFSENIHEMKVLGIIPLPSNRPAIIQRWIEADRAYRSVIFAMLTHVGGQPSESIFQAFSNLYLVVRGDPFLESDFWCKISESNAGGYCQYLVHEGQDNLLTPNIFFFNSLKSKIAKIYYYKGMAYYNAGHFSKAWGAFLKAGNYDQTFKMPSSFRLRLFKLKLSEKV